MPGNLCLAVGCFKPKVFCDMYMDDCVLNCCEKLKYLGCFIKCDVGFRVDFSDARRRYFSTLNSILSNSKYWPDPVRFEIIEKQCMPRLLYCFESFSFSAPEIRSVNSWINMAYRRVFGYNKWESVGQVICMPGRLNLTHLAQLRRILYFLRGLGNPII